MSTRQNWVGGGTAVLALVYAWVNTTFSPLIWAVLVITAIDLIFNIRDEAVQLQKMSKMIVAVVGGYFANTFQVGDPTISGVTMAHAVVGLVLAAQLSQTVPSLIDKLGMLFPKKDRAAIESALAQKVAELEKALQSAEAKNSSGGSGYLGKGS